MPPLLPLLLLAGRLAWGQESPAPAAADSLSAAPETVYVNQDSSTLFYLKEKDRKVEKVENGKPPALLVQTGKDTVFILKEKPIRLETTLDKVSRKIERSRELGYGGAGGPIPSLMEVDMTPVKDIILNSTNLTPADFYINSRFEPFFLMGGLGYGGVGNGVRIGGAGWGGVRTFVADPVNDTVNELNVSLGLGGFLVEKCLVRGPWNLVLGGIIGSGGLNVEKLTYKSGEQSPFQPTLYTSDDSAVTRETASARFFLLDVHAAFTYTLLPWMHLGAETSAGLFYSPAGFRYGSGSFFSANPGLRLRIIFGNLG